MQGGCSQPDCLAASSYISHPAVMHELERQGLARLVAQPGAGHGRRRCPRWQSMALFPVWIACGYRFCSDCEAHVSGRNAAVRALGMRQRPSKGQGPSAAPQGASKNPRRKQSQRSGRLRAWRAGERWQAAPAAAKAGKPVDGPSQFPTHLRKHHHVSCPTACSWHYSSSDGGADATVPSPWCACIWMSGSWCKP